ncbi:AraC family transcriptional regulator [Streptomyces sp. NPDC051776]|uniref:AraC family transcriptional regulator n=1 Tax=Streptomyces sp. NPDC051776 TaxID=3155414 RepID=UPI00342589C7
MTGFQPEPLSVRTLTDVDGVRVADVRCSAAVSPPGAEETDGLRRVAFPLRGVFSCVTAGSTHVAEPGCALLLEPGEPYRFGHPVGGGDECVVIGLDPEYWAQIVRTGHPLARTGRLVMPPRHLLDTLLFRASALRHGDDPHAIRELAMIYLGNITCADQAADRRTAPVPPSRHKAAHTAAAFVAEHYAEPMPRLLDAAAAAAGCSPYHLARAFRAVHGVTMHAYRERLRVAAALRALAEGADNLADLGTSLGYSSHGHFTDRLRRSAGAPPSRVRLLLREAAGPARLPHSAAVRRPNR